MEKLLVRFFVLVFKGLKPVWVLSVAIFLKCDSDWFKIDSLRGHNANIARWVGYGTSSLSLVVADKNGK